MSNNLFRKGLVAATIAGIAATAFAGAPAFADANVLFVPTTGTGNTTISGETFSLTASLGSLVPADKAPSFKFKVDNTSGVAATVKINGLTITAPGTATAAGTSAWAAGNATVAYTPSSLGNTSGSSLAATTTSAVFGLGSSYSASTSGAAIGDAYAAATASALANGSSPVLTIGGVDATKAADFTVTAFLDTNNNGVIDSGEFATSQPVHFVTVANSGLTTTFTKPVQNSTALAAKVSFTNSDINLAQIPNTHFAAAFGVYGVSGKTAVAGTSTVFTAGSIAGSAVSFSSTNNNYATSSVAASAAPAAGATYSAQAIYNVAGVSTTASNALVGAEAIQVVASTTDADSTGLVVAPAVSTDVKATTASAVGTQGDYKVRAGVTSTKVTATIKKTPTGGTATAVGAGVAVDVYVTAANAATPSGTGAVADTLTVAGTKVVTSGTGANVNNGTVFATVLTDASGVVTVPVLSSLGTAADSVTVSLKVQNAVSTATGSVALTWEAAALAAPVEIYTGNATQTVVAGSTVTKKFALADQFGGLYSGSSYELLYTVAGRDSATVTATPVNVYAPFVNGVATVTYTDNALSAGTNSAFYQILKNVNGAWVTATETALATANALHSNKGPQVDTNVIASAKVASAVSATATNNAGAASHTANQAATSSDVNASAYKSDLDVAGVYAAGDDRLAAVGNTAATATSVVTINGTVTDASGVAVPGAQVTVAAPGAQLTDASGHVLAVGSITVNAAADGTYSVTFASHKAGTNTVTITSGAATKSLSVYVAAAADNTGTVLTIAAPATLVPGQSANATVTLTDKFGNPVAVTDNTAGANNRLFNFAASTGVGTVTAKQTVADAAGTATVTITTGSADNGVITLTANYSKDATSANTVTATATIKVAAAAAAKTALAVGADRHRLALLLT